MKLSEATVAGTASAAAPSSTLSTEPSVLSFFFFFFPFFSSSAGAAASCDAQSPVALLHSFDWQIALLDSL